jgi:hypothetical protein
MQKELPGSPLFPEENKQMKLMMMAAGVLFATAMTTQAATFTPSAGLNLSLNQTQSNAIQAFSEKTGVTVGANQITVDFLVGTNLNVGNTKIGLNNVAANAPALTAGTYDSYLLHFDRLTNGSVSNVTFDFGSNIVGLILSNSGSKQLLNLSDSIFGTASAFDLNGSRRAETNDSFTLTNATTLTVSLLAGANFTDNIRVITAAAVAPVPLPASLPLLLAGFGGLAAMRRRRT